MESSWEGDIPSFVPRERSGASHSTDRHSAIRGRIAAGQANARNAQTAAHQQYTAAREHLWKASGAASLLLDHFVSAAKRAGSPGSRQLPSITGMTVRRGWVIVGVSGVPKAGPSGWDWLTTTGQLRQSVGGGEYQGAHSTNKFCSVGDLQRTLDQGAQDLVTGGGRGVDVRPVEPLRASEVVQQWTRVLTDDLESCLVQLCIANSITW